MPARQLLQTRSANPHPAVAYFLVMDHPLYDYSALPTRARTLWPGGQGLAAFVVLFL